MLPRVPSCLLACLMACLPLMERLRTDFVGEGLHTEEKEKTYRVYPGGVLVLQEQDGRESGSVVEALV